VSEAGEACSALPLVPLTFLLMGALLSPGGLTTSPGPQGCASWGLVLRHDAILCFVLYALQNTTFAPWLLGTLSWKVVATEVSLPSGDRHSAAVADPSAGTQQLSQCDQPAKLNLSARGF